MLKCCNNVIYCCSIVLLLYLYTILIFLYEIIVNLIFIFYTWKFYVIYCAIRPVPWRNKSLSNNQINLSFSNKLWRVWELFLYNTHLGMTNRLMVVIPGEFADGALWHWNFVPRYESSWAAILGLDLSWRSSLLWRPIAWN